MALEALRTALTMLSAASEASRERAAEATDGVLSLPGVGPAAAKAAATTGQITMLADEVLSAVLANRSMVSDTLRAEADMQLQRFGLITTGGMAAAEEEIDRLKAQVSDLRRALAARPAAAAAATGRVAVTPTRSALRTSAAAKAAARAAATPRVAAEKARADPPTKAAAAKRPAGPSPSGPKVAPRKAAVTVTPQSKPTAKKSAVKESAVKKSAVKKSATKKSVKTTPAQRTTPGSMTAHPPADVQATVEIEPESNA